MAQRPTASIGTLGLSRRNGHGILHDSNVQRCVPLNLEGLYSDIRDLKSRVLCDLKRIKLRGIESLCYSLERKGQGAADRRFFRKPDASSGTGILQPHEMPASPADHGVENERRDLFNNGPGFVDGLQAEV